MTDRLVSAARLAMTAQPGLDSVESGSDVKRHTAPYGATKIGGQLITTPSARSPKISGSN
jgi:hypothetical protein